MFIARMLIVCFFIATTINAMDRISSKPDWITDSPEQCTLLEPKLTAQLPEDLKKRYFTNPYDMSEIEVQNPKWMSGPETVPIEEFFQFKKHFCIDLNDKIKKDVSGCYPNQKNLYAQIETDLFVLAAHFLQCGVSLTYKHYPFVALCIYKQCHKDKDRFEAIASGLLSQKKEVTLLLGDTLFKILGPTIHEKMSNYKDAKKIIVEDFKDLLRKKATYFLFPTRQIATSGSLKDQKHFGTISSYENHSQTSTESKAVNSSTQWSWHYDISDMYIFKLFKNNATLRAQFGNPLIAIKTELLCTHDNGGFRNHSAITDHDSATQVWFGSKEKSFFIKQDKFEKSHAESMLDVNFQALYAVKPPTEKDKVIHALLYRYVKKIADRSSSFYHMLYRKADSDTMRDTVATVYNHDTKNSIWETAVSYICPISNLFFGTRRKQELGDIPGTSLINNVLVYENDTYSECPHFWYIHNRAKQRKKVGYEVRLNSSLLKTLIYLESSVTDASGQ